MKSGFQRIPTNLITGFLGAGKTTAIQSLLKQRPEGERWSIFVNEYGMVSIDHALFDASSEVQVQELAGGCFCCETAFLLKPMLAQFLKKTNPHRLLIEPTGAGHPASVIDTLRNTTFFRDMLDLRATICLVDPADFEDARISSTAVFHDQIQMADVVVLNRLDQRDPKLVERCRQWIQDIDPPKLLVESTSFAQLRREWLDLSGTFVRSPRFENAHRVEKTSIAESQSLSLVSLATPDQHGNTAKSPEPASVIELQQIPKPLQPVRLQNEGKGQWACGWIFSTEDVFHRDQLLDLLGYVHPIRRLKGIFRCTDGWWLLNRVDSQTSFQPSSYRRDSRLEVIKDEPTSGWPEFERKLIECAATS
jgi:G3E family GTPase